ncbi:hypothetical protein GCM10023225_05330 [Kineococcus glutinatus]|uniref:Uncharacterized protein n=1 Tax=Kineococcus glutinatus TaxID=1070872 RepID=A0ABP9H9R3_9ACTN
MDVQHDTLRGAVRRFVDAHGHAAPAEVEDLDDGGRVRRGGSGRRGPHRPQFRRVTRAAARCAPGVEGAGSRDEPGEAGVDEVGQPEFHGNPPYGRDDRGRPGSGRIPVRRGPVLAYGAPP